MHLSDRCLRVARRAVATTALALAAVLLAGPALAADLFYDATLDLEIGEDSRFFLNLTNRHYAPPQPVAVDVVTRCARPGDDFPVIMLLSEASGRDPGAILKMRLEGRSWSAIFMKMKVSHDILFSGLDRDPGPPYGKAWGHWKNHQGSKKKFSLADDQVVSLAKLQTVSSYYRVSPYRVVAEARTGGTVERYAVVHGRPAGAVPARKAHPAKGGHPEKARKHNQERTPGGTQAQGGGPNKNHR